MRILKELLERCAMVVLANRASEASAEESRRLIQVHNQEVGDLDHLTELAQAQLRLVQARNALHNGAAPAAPSPARRVEEQTSLAKAELELAWARKSLREFFAAEKAAEKEAAKAAHNGRHYGAQKPHKKWGAFKL